MGEALITGASAGLWAEFARQLADKGLDPVLVARRHDKLSEGKQQIESKHPTAGITLIAADLSDPEAPQAVATQVANAGIKLHYLVNNGGASGPRLLQDPDWLAHQAYLTLMMTSVTELCHRLIPAMLAAGHGRVINVASVAGRIASGGDSHYVLSKAYVIALSEALALTVKGQGVNVSALCPGFTHTDFHATAGMNDIKQTTPRWLWYGAEEVVREGINGVE